MSKYENALGIMSFTVAGTEFNIRPKKGDNLKLLKLYQGCGKDSMKFIESVVPFFVELISREEAIAKNSDEFGQLELFAELHITEIIQELMVAFKWTTREKLQEAEDSQLKDFQKGLVV